MHGAFDAGGASLLSSVAFCWNCSEFGLSLHEAEKEVEEEDANGEEEVEGGEMGVLEGEAEKLLKIESQHV